ncbi:hypothetical protein BVX98_01735, partial [bacterium F11]
IQMQVNSTVFTYDPVDITLLHAVGLATIAGETGSGDRTLATLETIFEKINNQARVDMTIRNTTIQNRDGSSVVSIDVTDFINDPVTGLVFDAEGYSDSTSQDGFGVTTVSHVDRTYEVIAGQARVSRQTTMSQSYEHYGTDDQRLLSLTEPYVQINVYNPNGRLQRVTDESGNDTVKIVQSSFEYGYHKGEQLSQAISQTHTTVYQKFVVIEEQARMKESTTESITTSSDGTVTSQTSILYNDLSERGKLIGANGIIQSSGLDAYGNRTENAITQNFIIIRDQARLANQTTETSTFDDEGHLTYHQEPLTLIYQYDDLGFLTEVTDGLGNKEIQTDSQSYEFGYDNADGDHVLKLTSKSLSQIRQTYIVVNNQARIATQINQSETFDLRDESTDSDDVRISRNYGFKMVNEYDQRGRLTRVLNGGYFDKDENLIEAEYDYVGDTIQPEPPSLDSQLQTSMKSIVESWDYSDADHPEEWLSSTETTSQQTYEVLGGQARVVEQMTFSSRTRDYMDRVVSE